MLASDGSKPNGSVPRKKSNFFRLSYVVAGLMGTVFFVCAGCCLLGPYFAGAQKLEGDAGANKVANGIVDWSLPSDFSGDFGFTIDNTLFRFDLAKFTHLKRRGMLLVAKLRWRLMSPPEQKDDSRKLIQNFVEQMAPELRKIDIGENETRAMTVKGLSGEIELSRGEDRASTAKYHQVVGYFHDKSDQTLLILQCEDEYLSEPEIDAFVKSIK